jgi:hypothetical protein
MKTTKHPQNPPSLSTIASIITPALQTNYTTSSATVTPCPDLTQAPFRLAAPGLCGDERIADVGGQANLFPLPQLECKYSLRDIAEAMDMSPATREGSLLGPGAGPFHVIGQNSELAASVGWKGSWDEEGRNVVNCSHVARIAPANKGGETKPELIPCPSTDCALMINLFGSSGLPGPVLKVTAKGRKGDEASFTQCIRKALLGALGDAQPVSIGGLFLIKRGRAQYHIMPDFPPKDQLPWTDREKMAREWLTYHEFGAPPMVCLTVFHSADPGGSLGLRMEHTHCFAADGSDMGGHYHYDLEGEEAEYEAYLNVAKTVYRIERPEGAAL